MLPNRLTRLTMDEAAQRPRALCAGGCQLARCGDGVRMLADMCGWRDWRHRTHERALAAAMRAHGPQLHLAVVGQQRGARSGGSTPSQPPQLQVTTAKSALPLAPQAAAAHCCRRRRQLCWRDMFREIGIVY